MHHTGCICRTLWDCGSLVIQKWNGLEVALTSFSCRNMVTIALSLSVSQLGSATFALLDAIIAGVCTVDGYCSTVSSTLSRSLNQVLGRRNRQIPKLIKAHKSQASGIKSKRKEGVQHSRKKYHWYWNSLEHPPDASPIYPNASFASCFGKERKTNIEGNLNIGRGYSIRFSSFQALFSQKKRGK
jgi:hypothetical protein